MDAGVVRTAIFAVIVAAVFGLAGFGVLALVLARLGWRRISDRERAFVKYPVIAAGLGAACIAYGRLIEVDWISETHLEIASAKLERGRRVRIVHLTDLHVVRPVPVIAELAARVNALAPDLVVFTGDSIGDDAALGLFRETLSAMKPRFGRFAVRGNHDVWWFAAADLFGGGVAVELTGTPTVAAGLVLCGARYDQEAALSRCLAGVPAERLRVAVYHTPDLVEDLAGAHAPDVYLAGHTHGGQVRLPFYGALVTLSKFDKKYEMGRYQVGATTLFVSRGVGVEPPPAPRVRFLCRPEIAVIDLIGGP